MKLYANDVLAGERTSQASFADIKVSKTNHLGRGLTLNVQDQHFCRHLDESHVWRQ